MSNKKKPSLATPEGRTKFAQESAAAAGEQRNLAVALFGAPAGGVGQALDPEKLGLKRRNMPAMFKPGDVPIGGIVSGIIVDIVKSPVSTIKGSLLHLKHIDPVTHEETGREFTFPCTGVIRNALAPGVEGEKEVMAALQEEIGKKFFAQRTEDKPSKYKKNMFMFDVFTK